MVFYLTDSLITAEDEAGYGEVCCVVNYFMVATQQGNHLILGDIRFLEWARSFYTRNNPYYGIITHLLNSFSTNTIPGEIEDYVRVVKGERSNVMENGITIHSIPYQEFCNLDSVSKMSIVGEDENDAKFYGHICRWYQKKIGTSYSTAHINEDGGGNKTYKKVGNLQGRKMPFVCIVDTDERYQGGTRGKTYEECNKLTYTGPMEHFHPIQAHEIENMIPKGVLDAIPCCSDVNKKKVKECYDNIWNNLQEKTHWKYVDLKSGMVKTSSLEKGNQLYNFFETIYNLNHQKNETFQEKYDATSMKNPIMSGFGGCILKEALEYFERNDIGNIKGFLDYQEEEWKAIGKLLLTKCICYSRETMNY